MDEQEPRVDAESEPQAFEDQEQPEVRGKLPGWLAVVLIVVAVGAAGWFVWRNVFSGPERQVATAVRDGIHFDRRVGGVFVKRGDSELFQRGPSVWVFYKVSDLDRIALHLLDRTSELSRYLNPSDNQRNQLLKLEYDVPITDAERTKLANLLMKYRAAFSDEEAGAAAADVLQTALSEIGAAHAAAAEASAKGRADRIAAILTADQLEKAKPWVANQIRGGSWMPLAPPPRAVTAANMQGGGKRIAAMTTTRPNGDGVTVGRRGAEAHVRAGETEMLQRSASSWVFYKLDELERVALFMVEDSDLEKQVGLKPEQRRELARLKYDVDVTPEQKKQLEALLIAYRVAATAGDQKAIGSAVTKLIEALAAVGQAHRQQAEAAQPARLKTIQQTLSMEQILKAKRWMSENAARPGWVPLAAPRFRVVPTTRPTGATTQRALPRNAPVRLSPARAPVTQPAK